MFNLRVGSGCFIASVMCLLGVTQAGTGLDPIVQNQDITTANEEGGFLDEFGYSISLDVQPILDNSHMLVGAPTRDPLGRFGSVILYNFKTASNSWEEDGSELPDQTNNNIDFGWYGAAVSILGDTAVVGAPKRDPIPPHENVIRNGAVFIYKQTGSTWSTIEVPGGTGAHLGMSVSQTSTLIAVGAPFHNGGYGGVYMYERANVGDEWEVATSVEDVLVGIFTIRQQVLNHWGTNFNLCR